MQCYLEAYEIKSFSWELHDGANEQTIFLDENLFLSLSISNSFIRALLLYKGSENNWWGSLNQKRRIKNRNQ